MAEENKTATTEAKAPKVEAKPAVKKEVSKAVSEKKVTPTKEDKSAKVEKPKKEKKPVASVPYVSNGEIRIELVGGLQGCTKRQIRTVQALGLKKIGNVKIHKDNPAIRGMCDIVGHLVKVEKVV